MDPADNSNRCIVEDRETWATVIGLMRHHMPLWPKEGAKEAPVYIKTDSEITKLKLPVLKLEFEDSNRKALGVVIDAETNANSVWQRALPFLQGTFQTVPNDLPAEGLVLTRDDGRRFGLWVMPDNRSSGMVENFLADLVREGAHDLWQFAKECVQAAREREATFREIHRPKANLHTYLAWQDPPGFNAAVVSQVLDPNAAKALAFVEWFRRLYQL
jgi:hypothetical protein